MKTKKLHIWVAALFLSLFAFNATAAGVTYTLALNADPTNLNNWGKTSATVGSHPASFGLANTTFLINKAGNYTMGANWSVTAGSSIVIIGNGVTFSDGGHNMNLSGSPTSFSVSTTGVANISGNGTVVGATIDGTINISGTASFGNTQIDAGSLVNVTGAATLSGVSPVAGTLTVANAAATVSNLTINSGGVVNLNVAVTVAAISVTSGGILNVNANAVIGSSLTTTAGSTVNVNFTNWPVFATTYNGTLNINNPAYLYSTTTIKGSLVLNAILTLNFSQLVFGGTGTVSGASTITGDVTSGITISASSAVGTLNFTPGSNTIGYLDMSSATGSVTLGTNLTISDDGSQTSNLDLSGGTLILNDKTLTADATTAFVTFGGTITGSSSSIMVIKCDPTIGEISGTMNMDQTTAGTTNALSSFTMNDGGLGQTIALGNELDIIDSIVPTAGTIDVSAGLLKLVYASTTKTGRVGMIGNTGAISGSNVNISITRPGANSSTNGTGADWCMMGYPGVVPSADFTWLQGQVTMQCPNCPDGYYYGFTSVQKYTEATDSYTGISNTTDAMSTTDGYWFYLSQNNSIPITATGSIQSAAGAGITFALTNGSTGYNLVYNPVPSPISWTALWNGNGSVSSTYAVYNPQTGAYAYYTSGVGASGSGALTDNIAPGQGFFAQATAAGNLTVFEGNKTGGAAAEMKSGHNSTMAGFNYFKLGVDGNSRNDKTVFIFNAGSSAGLDNYDAKKMDPGTAGILQISSYSNNMQLAVNAQGALTQNYSLPVKIVTGTTGSYQITPEDMANMPAGACIKLHDNYTSADYDLTAGAFSVTLNDTETVARFMLNITINPLQITANTKQATCHASNNGYITAIGNSAGPWNYTWKNSGNTVVKTTLNSMSADTLNGLNSGVYSVDVTTVGSCDVATQTFTLTAPGATTSAFTASSTTVNVNNNVTFTDNSANADTYSWNFGDGNTSNIQSPVYAYAVPGNYTVKFYAINSACGDSALATKTITVLGTTGIAGSASNNDEVVVGKDASGSFVKFNYASQTKVTINVYNSLGQFVLSNASLPVYNDKIYLNLDNSKDQVLFVSVSNLDKNTQVTKKLFNN